MSTISEILTLDLNEDIKNVIDLEDRSENEIQQEIESYIVTEGLSKHLSNFCNQYTSNIKETGVWISGFYGSGKSYFGKMLGYLIDNPMINGTSARDRFIPRIRGVKNESFLENDIRSLDAINTRVIFLDVAKQNTDNGLAYTLFSNFLKNLGFRSDLYGYMEYELFIDGKYEFLEEKSQELFSKSWDELKKSNREVARAMRQIYSALDYSEDDYKDTQKIYSDAIDNFDATKLKNELEKYLSKVTNETLVFIFDEASEAISQKKFSLLDLEGISESFSNTSLGSKVWTIAIAQEKLDDVINNSNVSKSNLIKVTDRFKTKLHLEATEVDVIIKSRLLKKKDEYFNSLVEYHKKNNGLISDVTNLKSSFPTKTTDANEFATYYPFHKYQFNLLQKFLFSSNALAATQIAARGMIITTFDVLRKQLKDKELFDFTTIHEICTQAQTQPPSSLGVKYEDAKKILENVGLSVDGIKLLKTIHFLTESELAFPNIENITKGYICDLTTYYDFKSDIQKALDVLVEQKQLLLTNSNYKITTDEESKLLEEMNDFDVELFIKKRDMVNYLKKTGIFNQISTINDDSQPYKFNIITDQEDEISSSSNKQLGFTVYSLFNINGLREDFIEDLKLQTQYDKDNITLVPNIDSFQEIDKLISDIKKYSHMEEKYATESDNTIKAVIREFSTIKEEAEKSLVSKVSEAYLNGSLIYMYDEILLNGDSFKGSVNETQRKLIKNIYTKRLNSSLSDSLAPKILSENSNDKLNRYFSSSDFAFFDKNGNFVGDSLKVVEEIGSKLIRLIDGKSLEQDLSMAPWGYTFGTIITTLAALFRAGRLIVKYNNQEYFSYSDKSVQEVFTNTTKFKLASFKSLNKSLSSSNKNLLVQTLMDLDYKKHTGQNIDWSTNDFELADAIKILADQFIAEISAMQSTVDRFDNLFSQVASLKPILQSHTLKTQESNYIEKVEQFLAYKEEFSDAISKILKAQKFIKNNFDIVKGFRRFFHDVESELKKANRTNIKIDDNKEEFDKLFNENMVKNFAQLQQLAINTKDEYFKMMKDSSELMSTSYSSLLKEIKEAISDLNTNYPQELNTLNLSKLNSLKSYCESKIETNLKLEYHTKCQNSGYTLSDILHYIEIIPVKESDLTVIKSSFIKVAPQEESSQEEKKKESIKITLKTTKKTMSVKEYRKYLASKLQEVASKNEEDEIEIID